MTLVADYKKFNEAFVKAIFLLNTNNKGQEASMLCFCETIDHVVT